MVYNPFTIQVAENVLIDLRERLARTRWPDEIHDADWDYGTNLAYLQQLVQYWHESYDWRAQERLLNTFPQFSAQIDGIHLHFLHVKGKGTHPVPLIISHGWPGSFFEMYKIIGPLTDPTSYGGDPADAFDVVVPSLPGYGFSGPTNVRGVNVMRIAGVFTSLMQGLGYERFAAQGGDWGGVISSTMGSLYPDQIMGIHLNFLGLGLDGKLKAPTNEEERLWLERMALFSADGSAYSHIQGTRPQTLAYGLNDAPVGLAGWIIEKFRAWSDCHGDIESVFTKDELLTNVMIYWVTQTINSSTRLYYETFRQSKIFPEWVEVPTGIAVFPKEIPFPPRSLAQQHYNIHRWTEMKAGGHFAALEQPQTLVEDIRAFFRPLRN